MTDKNYKWEDVDIFIGGKKIDVKSIVYNPEPLRSEKYVLTDEDLNELFQKAPDKEAQCNYLISIIQKMHPDEVVELCSLDGKLVGVKEEYVLNYIVNPIKK
jgi:hypothetical protein